MRENDSSASGRGALAELKDAVANLFEQVAGLAPDLSFSRDFPRHELRVEDDGYVVKVELPDVKREAVEVTVSGQSLSISGERRRFEPPEAARVLRSERPHGKFDLSVRLPSPVNDIAVVAQMRDGVLEVHLPKPSATRGRSIRVEEAGESEPKQPPSGGEPEGPLPWEEGQQPEHREGEGGGQDHG